jgi:hypothetical protein
MKWDDSVYTHCIGSLKNKPFAAWKVCVIPFALTWLLLHL